MAVDARSYRTLSAPGYLACIWTIVVAFVGSAGFIIGQYRLPFWIGTAILVVALIHHRPKANLRCWCTIRLATAVVMLPWLSHGISTYPGSIFWDGWWYLAVGETIKDNSLSALMPPDSSPMYELGFSSLPVRFITAALIAMFQGVIPPGGDTQATIGFLLFFYVFVLACSIGALGLVLFPDGPAARLGYIVAGTISGFVITMLHANNFDQLFAMAVLPLTAAIAFRLEWADRKAAVVLGAVCAALVLIYPELSPATVGIPALILMWRLWDERPDVGPVAITVAFGALVFVVLLAACAPFLFRLFQHEFDVVLVPAGVARPGEGYFPAFYKLRCTFGSFAMLYAPFVQCGTTFLAKLTEAVGGLVCIATIVGILIARGRFIAIALCAIIPFLAACVMLLFSKYEYGAYKLLAVGFPFCMALLVFAVASLRTQWLQLATAAATATYAIVVGLRIAELDAAARDKSVEIWKVQGIPANSVVALKIKDDLSFQWATYYLRQYRLKPIVGHLIYLQNPRAKVANEPPTYLVTDQAEDNCYGEPIWQSSAYKVLKVPRLQTVMEGQPRASQDLLDCASQTHRTP